VHQRRAEAHRVHGGLEQIHLEAWRKGAPLLQTTQASRVICVDSRGRPSPSSAQGLLIQATSPHGSPQKGAAIALPRCDYSRGQYCHRCRVAGRRPHLPSPATSLLRQRGLVRIQGTLPTSTEATVRSAHQPRGSYGTTSRSTRSVSSPTTRSATSCGTKMLLEESPSGQSSSAPSASTSSHVQPSSRKH
jgi:hypothetical protein